MSDSLFRGRDAQLLQEGWQFNTETGEYRELHGEWMPLQEARIVAGLDIKEDAPPPLARITITALSIDMAHAIGVIRFGDVVTGFTAPLTGDERTALDRFLGSVASRLDRESRL